MRARTVVVVGAIGYVVFAALGLAVHAQQGVVWAPSQLVEPSFAVSADGRRFVLSRPGTAARGGGGGGIDDTLERQSAELRPFAQGLQSLDVGQVLFAPRGALLTSNSSRPMNRTATAP